MIDDVNWIFRDETTIDLEQSRSELESFFDSMRKKDEHIMFIRFVETNDKEVKK